jgi:hypothetical protein
MIPKHSDTEATAAALDGLAAVFWRAALEDMERELAAEEQKEDRT